MRYFQIRVSDSIHDLFFRICYILIVHSTIPYMEQCSCSSQSLQCSMFVVFLLPLYTYIGLEENKAEMVRQGAVEPLLNLTKSADGRVQRNAAGALLNLTHIGKDQLSNSHYTFRIVQFHFRREFFKEFGHIYMYLYRNSKS